MNQEGESKAEKKSIPLSITQGLYEKVKADEDETGVPVNSLLCVIITKYYREMERMECKNCKKLENNKKGEPEGGTDSKTT